MNKWLVALLGATLHVSLAISVLACESPEEKIIWMDSTQKSAMFIPEKLLQEVDWSKLPLKDSDRNSLAARIRRPQLIEERKKLLGRADPLCDPSPSSEGGGSSPEAKSLHDWMKDYQLTVIGRIAKVVPGWKTWGNEVVQMVYVEVVDVLQDRSGVTKSNTVLLYDVPYGSILLQGTEICRDPWKGFKAPAEGDRILLLGNPYWDDPRIMTHTFVFPVENGLALYQPYSHVKKFNSVIVKALL